MRSAEWLGEVVQRGCRRVRVSTDLPLKFRIPHSALRIRSEEHTSELQSRLHLVCRLLLEKKKKLASTTTRTSSAARIATVRTPHSPITRSPAALSRKAHPYLHGTTTRTLPSACHAASYLP